MLELNVLFRNKTTKNVDNFIKQNNKNVCGIYLTPCHHNLDHIEAVLLRQLKCCHTRIMGVTQHKYPMKSQYTDTRPTNNLGEM
jgi:hypothetical protein